MWGTVGQILKLRNRRHSYFVIVLFEHSFEQHLVTENHQCMAIHLRIVSVKSKLKNTTDSSQLRTKTENQFKSWRLICVLKLLLAVRTKVTSS